MKYQDGYIVDADVLAEMATDDLESVVVRLRDDMYISDNRRRELLELYLKARKERLDAAFVYTQSTIEQMKVLNDTIIRQTREVMQLASEIYQSEQAALSEATEEYDSLRVSAQLTIPRKMARHAAEKEYGKEHDIWSVIAWPERNQKLDFHSVLGSQSTFSMHDEEGFDLEKKIDEVLYLDANDHSSWADCMDIDRKAVEDICFVWPFHNIYDYCNLAMSDILRIKEFKMKVEVEYENV